MFDKFVEITMSSFCKSSFVSFAKWYDSHLCIFRQTRFDIKHIKVVSGVVTKEKRWGWSGGGDGGGGDHDE